VHTESLSALKSIVDMVDPSYAAALKNTSEVFTVFAPTDEVSGCAGDACMHGGPAGPCRYAAVRIKHPRAFNGVLRQCAGKARADSLTASAASCPRVSVCAFTTCSVELPSTAQLTLNCPLCIGVPALAGL
jgi:hypothetical protein